MRAARAAGLVCGKGMCGRAECFLGEFRRSVGSKQELVREVGCAVEGVRGEEEDSCGGEGYGDKGSVSVGRKGC
ncbi:hypothetical protein [Bartonella bovis]|uniref:hypothetical protein n=1 Tax=Bartonella bovis TaxID=155194 RepID=UPI000550A2B9|nr:hypothetical protein [Bartonella bovis]